MKQKSIRKNAILNVIKQCVNIIVPLITYPYVSRVLGAGGVGRYGFADSIIVIMMIFASLGISSYAVREGARIRDSRTEITRFSAEIFSINMITTAVTYIVLFLIILFVDRVHRDAAIILLVSLNIITSVAGRDWINTIYEDFTYIALRYCGFQLMATLLIFLLIRGPQDYLKYTAIMVFGNAGAYTANIFYTMRYVPLRLTTRLNLKKHLRPAIYLFCITLTSQIYVHSDITILGFFRPDQEVGIYTIASKVYMIIKHLLNAIIWVTVPRLSNSLSSGDPGRYKALLDTLRRYLYVLVFPCVTGLFFLSGEVMWLIGGEGFLEGALSLRILCIALAFAVFSCFYANAVMTPNRKDRQLFIATLASSVVNIAANFVAIPAIGMNGAAITTAVAECLVLLICMYYSRDISMGNRLKGDLRSVLAGCVGIGLVCVMVKSVVHSTIPGVVASILLSTVAYVITILIMKNSVALRFFRETILSREKDHRL